MNSNLCISRNPLNVRRPKKFQKFIHRIDIFIIDLCFSLTSVDSNKFKWFGFPDLSIKMFFEGIKSFIKFGLPSLIGFNFKRIKEILSLKNDVDFGSVVVSPEKKLIIQLFVGQV